MRKAISTYFASINGEDWDRLAALFHDDAELQAPGTAPRIGGRAVASYYDDALRPYPVHRDEPTREIYAETTVTVEIHFEGQLASGAPMAFDAVDVFDFVDGKIANLSSWYDSALVRSMLLEAATTQTPAGEPAAITPARRRYAMGRARRGVPFRLDDQSRPATWSAGADGVATRGVLLDLADGTPLGPDTLDAAAAAQRTELRPGDALLVRTQAAAAALDLGAWLENRAIAAIAFDSAAPDADLGIPVGGNWALDALHADCSARGSWDGFLVSVPDGERANAVLFR